MKIILASTSPRRYELLKNAGLVFETCSPNSDEIIKGYKSVKDYVLTLAVKKANSVSVKNAIIIGADTVVCLDGKIIGKPKDEADAIRTLKMLSNKTHSVYTGYAVKYNEKLICGVEETKVVFNNLSEKDISNYVNSGLYIGKAGSYGIQDGFNLVKNIDGDYDNVVGLPTKKILNAIKEIV